MQFISLICSRLLHPEQRNSRNSQRRGDIPVPQFQTIAEQLHRSCNLKDVGTAIVFCKSTSLS